MLPGDKNSDNNETDNAVTSNAVTALPGVPALRSYTAELVLDASPQRNTNLKMLSEELERQTKVTQKLQERVEQATKLTMERMEHTIGRVTSGASTSLRLHSSDVPSQLKVPEAQSLSQNSGVLPDSCDLDILFHNMNYTRKDTVEEYSQKVSELQRQLSKTHEHHKKQNAYLRQCIMKLQTKLHESQIEMDALLELRMKESQGQADLVGKLQQTIGELQARKQAGDQRLLDAEERAQSLCRKKEALELSLQEVISVLMVYEKGSGRNTYVVQHAASPDQLSLGAAVGSVLKDLEAENVSLRGRILPMEEQLEALKLECQGKIVLMMKEQTERRQAEEQTSVYQSQMTDLESALSSLRSELLEAQQTHKDK
ncbi:hypothetical protein MATL_G00068120 [Megalops atlanticus]|uniref:Uncharacterized protein n=1 Tax=Megalops atlanticus TaxID=7932 RepID=A0A9D3QAN3_MEGAT|nr:hypothetical protein MATL_G00068120 [Megalops atlanticus]